MPEQSAEAKPAAKAAAKAKADKKSPSAFNIYMSETLKNVDFMPGLSRKERFVAAAAAWTNPNKPSDQSHGCSKCTYHKNGCRKCNPARFEGR
jgi:hypothetical protein